MKRYGFDGQFAMLSMSDLRYVTSSEVRCALYKVKA